MWAALEGTRALFFKPKKEPKVEEPAPKNISEPVLTICKLMEENPRRFKVRKSDSTGIVLEDSVTGVIYMSTLRRYAYDRFHVLIAPTCFNQEENEVLGSSVCELRNTKRELVAKIRTKRFKRVHDRERNRLMSLYCNTPD